MNATRGRHWSWHGDAARLRSRADVAAAACRRERHQADRKFRGLRSSLQIAGSKFRAATAPMARSIADQWMEPKEQRKVDDFILFAMAAAKQALDDADWHPQEYEDQITSGVLIGSGIGGIEGIAETALLLHDRGPAPGVAVLHSRAGSSTLRPATCRSRIRSRAPTRGGHRLFDRRARDRRCRPAGRARRRRRDGGRRHRIAGQSIVGRRLRRLPRVVDRIQRHARSAPRDPTTAIATASSWARGPA